MPAIHKQISKRRTRINGKKEFMNIAQTIANMEAAGMTADAIVLALKCIAVEAEPKPSVLEERAARKREADRVRMAESRATVALQSRDPDVKKEIPHTPLEKTTTNNTPIAREAKGTRLPETFEPLPATLALARDLGFSNEQIKFEIADFTDYWRGVPGAKGRKTDWQGTLRNRFRDVHRRKKPTGNAKSSAAQEMRDALADLSGSGTIVGF